jgi:ribosome-binding factor A
MATLRQEKYAALLRRELGNYFLQSARNFGKGVIISITQVRVSPDLGHAKVYLSVFGIAAPDELINELTVQTPAIRAQLGRMIGKQVRVIPDLAFFLDDSAAYAAEIDRLLKD